MHKAILYGQFALVVLALALGGTARAKEPPPPMPDPPEERKEPQDVFKALEEARKTIEAMKEELARLRKDVDDLRKQQSATSRSRFGGARQTGTIRLVNTYVRAMRIVVNGTAYTLAPGETRLLRDQVPGGFTYEIPGVKGPVDRTLDADETFTIRVFVK
jgi:hypothetical protein